jgi:hypothetical protein
MKKQRTPKTWVDQAADLAEFAEKQNLADDAFDGELQDECDNEATLMFDNLKGGTWREKMEFLLSNGFTPTRLRQLIRQYRV